MKFNEVAETGARERFSLITSSVANELRHLLEPSAAFVRAQGLASARLLARGDPARVTYAVALYERTRVGNVVRVQVDNVDAPFNVIERSRLQLGSTAKLRTLISYLEIVEALHARYAPWRSTMPGWC